MSTDAQLLADIPIFQLLDNEEQAVLAQHIERRRFAAGATIFRDGDRGDAMFVIRSGEVELWLYDEDRQRVALNTFTGGDLFGELSLLDSEPRAATATALTDTDVLVIDREDLRLLFSKKPDAALDILAILGQRLRQTDQLIRARAARNANEVIAERLTLGQRLADRIAAFGGSWNFITLFGLVLISWMIVNSLLAQPFDPFPFILLNLVLSSLAALQAPVIMMSQNRADVKDRIRAELDYQVNLKAEMEIAALHEKVDALREELLRSINIVARYAAGGEN
jgi:CRP/FNR family cyclic AMP-dependent transcriptional regulator